jgi:hypothetical protein
MRSLKKGNRHEHFNAEDSQEEQETLWILELIQSLLDLVPFQIADSGVVGTDTVDGKNSFVFGQESGEHGRGGEEEVDDCSWMLMSVAARTENWAIFNVSQMDVIKPLQKVQSVTGTLSFSGVYIPFIMNIHYGQISVYLGTLETLFEHLPSIQVLQHSRGPSQKQ